MCQGRKGVSPTMNLLFFRLKPNRAWLSAVLAIGADSFLSTVYFTKEMISTLREALLWAVVKIVLDSTGILLSVALWHCGILPALWQCHSPQPVMERNYISIGPTYVLCATFPNCTVQPLWLCMVTTFVLHCSSMLLVSSFMRTLPCVTVLNCIAHNGHRTFQWCCQIWPSMVTLKGQTQVMYQL